MRSVPRPSATAPAAAITAPTTTLLTITAVWLSRFRTAHGAMISYTPRN